MNMLQYIREKYDITDKLRRMRRNPLQEAINSDDFPYDFIVNENGEFVKMLYYDKGERTISVYDLLMWKRDELVVTGDKPLLELYDNYLADFEISTDFLEEMILASKDAGANG